MKKQNILILMLLALSFITPNVISEVICFELESVSAGEKHTLALTTDKSLWACGSNKDKQAGLGNNYPYSYSLKRVRGENGIDFFKNIASYDAGWYHSLAADVNGTIWSWGTDNYGQLGNGPIRKDEYFPSKVAGLEGNGFLNNIVYVSAGRSGTHSLVIDVNGFVYAWGNNSYGQCGDGTSDTKKDYPVLVLDDNLNTTGVYLGDIAHIVQVDAGEHHSIALGQSGNVWMWGQGSSTGSYPVKVRASSSFGGQPLSNIMQISSYAHSIALDSSGCVWEWINSYTAYKIPGGQTGTMYLENIAEVRAGCMVSMARTIDGRVLTWYPGSNADPKYVPSGQMQTPSGKLENITALDAGGYDYKYHVAVSQDGSGWAWGVNPYGELGLGDPYERTEPTRMLCPAISDSSGIIYVDKDAAEGLNNGSSWDNAYTSFADALREADIYAYEIGPCEIWTAAGNYKPTYDAPIRYDQATFRVPIGNITTMGHFGGIGVYETSPQQRDFNNPAYETILDGNVGPETWKKAQYTVMCADIGQGLVLDGFTFTGASSAGLYIKQYSDPSVIRCKFNGNSTYGIEARDFSYPDVADCVFLENGTAGIYSDKSAWPYVKNCLFDGNNRNSYGLYGSQSDMLIEDCVIKRQSSYGIYFTTSPSLEVNRCQIENNNGTGIYCYSCPYIILSECNIRNNGNDGIYTSSSNFQITDSIIQNNLSYGIYGQYSYMEITNCKIQSNKDGVRSKDNSAPVIKNTIISINKNNGIYSEGCGNIIIQNNWIYLNGTSETHSGIYLKNSISPPVVTNNTIVSNPRYGIYIDYGRDPCLVNNIIWSNSANPIRNVYSLRGLEGIEASYNCIGGGFDGIGNIDTDPCFRDASANDYHLDSNSLCINAGDPCGVYDDQTDIDGRKRVIYKRVDIGADEWANPPDYNLDGFVNFIDYSMLAQAWLTEDSDINLDDDPVVNENDLFMFAQCWAWSAYKSKADLNSDNIVDFRDFAVFAETWDEDFNALAEFCKDWLWEFTWD